MSKINTSFERILTEYAEDIYQESKSDDDANIVADAQTIRQKFESLKQKQYSDIQSTDKQGQRLQWVNFVQEGGGTLGLALVGYAFVLEYVGLRFLRLAGTSAGAINTIFLAAIGGKDDPKTPEIYDMLQDKNRFDIKSFVDTKIPFLKSVIFLLGKGRGLEFNIFSLIAALLAAPIIIYLVSAVFDLSISWALIFLMTSGGIFLYFLFKRIFDKYAFGINSGDIFEKTLKRELAKFDVKSSHDLHKADLVTTIEQSENDLDGIKLELVEHNLSMDIHTSVMEQIKRRSEKIRLDYSLVASDISNQFKVVLPAEADLYFESPHIVNPALYVRASMAVPAFFEPQYFPEKPRRSNIGAVISDNCKTMWTKRKGIPASLVASKGILVDGGVLSNFPINILHNQNIRNPRMPIMGARLVDTEKLASNEDGGLKIGDFLGKIINTLRSNEDNGFLANNPFYRTYCIKDIDLVPTKVNWLNFDLTDKEKNDLFRTGMLAAIDFLDKFDWEEYKQARIQLHDNLDHDLVSKI